MLYILKQEVSLTTSNLKVVRHHLRQEPKSEASDYLNFAQSHTHRVQRYLDELIEQLGITLPD